MLRKLNIIFIFNCILQVCCFGQEPDPGPGYQMMMINNPSLAGSGGDGELRLSYLNFFPGNGYNLHSVYFSYDSYFQTLHGGAGIYLADDYLGGIINDFRGGLSYSYFLQAGKDLFINAGLSASLYHRGFDFDNAILPDQIDALGGVTVPSSEVLALSGRTVFDVAAGFLFISGKFSGGFSINHLAEPDLSTTGNSNERLKRKVLIHLTGDFFLDESQNLKIQPLTYLEFQRSYLVYGAGAALSSKYLSVNAIVMQDNSQNLNIQTGFSLTSGRISVYYNYRFNAISGNKFMPFSLLHETGLALGLNNVEKRNIIKTINFPKM
ncbi:MAG TPA: PorP/SprF family type IX secretion system membrane protein [Bacteroidales bacterium]|nr:PorP/SprF family type IX secretion system membrane protein [Bacteroidales bacterium]